MNRILHILLFISCPIILMAQNPNGNYNPYVNSGTISPSPLSPVEVNGTGVISFNLGNSGSDDLEVFQDQFITLTITLSYGEPDNSDPASAISGSYAGLFSWSYESGTYTAIQTSTIPSNSSGLISIDYKVTKNSSSPGLNGFNINISPAPYQTESNSQADDAVSSYTYTEIRDFGDAPESYGSASHILDFENYLGNIVDGDPTEMASESADADDLDGEDDEDGIVFPEIIRQGENIEISVTITGLGRLNAWIDWNGDGDFNDSDERIADNVAMFDDPDPLSVEIPSTAIISSSTFARFRFSPSTLSEPTGIVTGGEAEDYQILILPSLLAPTAPEGLKSDSSSVDYVHLSWTSSPVEEEVNSYRIYRNSSFVGSSDTNNYTDYSVESGNTYFYSVSAVNSAGLEGPLSESVSAGTFDTDPPTVPTGLIVTSVSVDGINLSWNASTDNVAVSGYKIYRDGEFIATSTTTNFTDENIAVGNTYSYSVSSLDEAGNESEQSSAVTAGLNDTTPPEVPDGLEAELISLFEVSLNWNESTDDVGVTAYRIYRNGSFLASSQVNSYSDNSLEPGNDYTYQVSAIDAAGNESDLSEEVTVNTDDNEAPTTPEKLEAISISGTSVSLVWNPSTDNAGVAGYDIYRDNEFLETTTISEYTDNSVLPETSYSYKVRAFDDAGNYSLFSEELDLITVDITPPSVPTGLIALSVDYEGLTLTWEESTDNVEVSGYRVYKNEDLLLTVNGTSGMDVNIEKGKTYSYSVSAFDNSGNESEKSEPLVISITSSDFIIVSDLSIYPNPSGGSFEIGIHEESGQFTMEIISTDGVCMILKNIEMGESKAMEFNQLERGIYYIRLYNEERIYLGKFIIIK